MSRRVDEEKGTTADETDVGLNKLREMVRGREAWCAVALGSQSQTLRD